MSPKRLLEEVEASIPWAIDEVKRGNIDEGLIRIKLMMEWLAEAGSKLAEGGR